MCSATYDEDYTDPFNISWYNGTQLLQPDGKNYLIYRKYDTMNDQIYSKLTLSIVSLIMIMQYAFVELSLLHRKKDQLTVVCESVYVCTCMLLNAWLV